MTNTLSLRQPLLLITVLFWITTTPGISAPFGADSSSHITLGAPKTAKWLHANNPHVHEFSIWGGYAFDSFTLWGKTPDATFSQFGLGYNRKFLRFGDQLLEYRLEFNIYSRISYPEFEPDRHRTSLSGFGITPLGLRINFMQSRRLQPFLGISGGFMFLDRPFPDDRGEKFNFTFGAGGGLEILLNAQSSISFGYKYFHLSNGETGQVNPGIDSGFFFASLSFF